MLTMVDYVGSGPGGGSANRITADAVDPNPHDEEDDDR